MLTYFSEPPQKSPYADTCPTVGTETLEVSDVVIADPTAAKFILVTVTNPAAVVFKTFSFDAFPSATTSAALIICEYELF